MDGFSDFVESEHITVNLDIRQILIWNNTMITSGFGIQVLCRSDKTIALGNLGIQKSIIR